MNLRDLIQPTPTPPPPSTWDRITHRLCCNDRVRIADSVRARSVCGQMRCV